MNGKKPLILLSNDDGIRAAGMNALIRFVRTMGDIVVMAPDVPRSGASCAISSQYPVDFTLVKREPGLRIYKCSGTPVDCIKLAKQEVLDKKPDLIIGGINHGCNASVNVHYSGTMSIAIEGALSGIPSLAFSIDNPHLSASFEHCEFAVKKIVKYALEQGLPKGICLNVNFPGEGELKGIKLCRQTRGMWTQEWEKCERANGYTYYWLSGHLENEETEAEDSDLWAIKQHYAAITPIDIDMTAHPFIEGFRKTLEE